MINPSIADSFYMNAKTSSARFDTDSFLEESPKELDAIEVLVQMAKQGKIDPWRIDIADIADKYMLHISESKSNNLRITGRAIFFLAVLLKMKSDILVGIDPMDFTVTEQIDPEYDDSDDSRFSDELYFQNYYPDNVIPLDDIIQRRTSVKQNRKRTLTLKDLIRQLEFYENLDKKERIERRNDRALRRVRNYSNLTSSDIINLAQEEYIENSVKILNENLTRIFEHEEKVELKTLTLLGLDKLSAYIALLFLTADSDFDLEQEEFYSDLYVVKNSTSEETETSESVAETA